MATQGILPGMKSVVDRCAEAILAYCRRMWAEGKHVFARRHTFAKWYGYALRTIDRALAKLVREGLIRRLHRYRHSSLCEPPSDQMSFDFAGVEPHAGADDGYTRGIDRHQAWPGSKSRPVSEHRGGEHRETIIGETPDKPRRPAEPARQHPYFEHDGEVLAKRSSTSLRRERLQGFSTVESTPQHHQRDDADLRPEELEILEIADLHPRHVSWIRRKVQQGIDIAAIKAGVILGRVRKWGASNANERIKSMAYFEGPVAEGLSAGPSYWVWRNQNWPRYREQMRRSGRPA